MKKFFIIMLVLFPVMLSAQGRHHFEAGAGYASPGELFFQTPLKETGAVNLYGEYRFDLTDNFAVGARYSFVTPHKSGEDLTSDEKVRNTTNYHTLNAIVEYKTGAYGPMRLFVGIGGGAQLRYVYSPQSVQKREQWYPSADIYAHAGLEFFNHLRLTVGHSHDLHYPFSQLSTGAPFYHFSIGWSF